MLKIKALSLLMLVVMILTACAPASTPVPAEPSAPSEPSTPPEAGAPEKIDEPASSKQTRSDTLVIGVPHVPSNVQPTYPESDTWSLTIINVYERLWSWDYAESPSGSGVKLAMTEKGDSAIVGELLESWERTSDTEYVLHVRKGVKSNFGNELTADDIIWSVERLFGLDAPGVYLWTSAGVTDMDHIVKVDDYTLNVRTDTPNPLFPRHPMVMFSPIIDSVETKKHATDDDPYAQDWLSKNTATYGAHYVEEIVPGQSMTLVANPNYYGPEPYFKKIIYREVPEASNRFTMLVNGDLDTVSKYLTYDQMAMVRDGMAGNTRIITDPDTMNTWNWLYINTTKEPFIHEKARQALAYAVPYEDIVSSVFRDFAIVSKGNVAPKYQDAIQDCWPYKHDLEMAKKLWDESGAERKFQLTWSNEMPFFYDIGALIQTELAKIGVEMELNPVPAATYQQKMFLLDYDVNLEQGNYYAGDTGNHIQGAFGDSPFNNTGFYDEEQIALGEQYMTITADDPRRPELLRQGQCLLNESVPGINVAWMPLLFAAQEGLEGWSWNTDAFPRFRYLYWAD